MKKIVGIDGTLKEILESFIDGDLEVKVGNLILTEDIDLDIRGTGNIIIKDGNINVIHNYILPHIYFKYFSPKLNITFININWICEYTNTTPKRWKTWSTQDVKLGKTLFPVPDYRDYYEFFRMDNIYTTNPDVDEPMGKLDVSVINNKFTNFHCKCVVRINEIRTSEKMDILFDHCNVSDISMQFLNTTVKDKGSVIIKNNNSKNIGLLEGDITLIKEDLSDYDTAGIFNIDKNSDYYNQGAYAWMMHGGKLYADYNYFENSNSIALVADFNLYARLSCNVIFDNNESLRSNNPGGLLWSEECKDIEFFGNKFIIKKRSVVDNSYLMNIQAVNAKVYDNYCNNEQLIDGAIRYRNTSSLVFPNNEGLLVITDNNFNGKFVNVVHLLSNDKPTSVEITYNKFTNLLTKNDLELKKSHSISHLEGNCNIFQICCGTGITKLKYYRNKSRYNKIKEHPKYKGMYEQKSYWKELIKSFFHI